jgi:hypothetical protein
LQQLKKINSKLKTIKQLINLKTVRSSSPNNALSIHTINTNISLVKQSLLKGKTTWFSVEIGLGVSTQKSSFARILQN